MAGDAKEPFDGDLPSADNSDPTGIGPPPPGAATEVTPDGHGVTHAVEIAGEREEETALEGGAKPG
jgi:hypothetical protein